MDLKQGDLENIILNALWDLEGEQRDKIFVGDVQEKIKSSDKKWAYTTVKTVLDRLVDKEIAIREKEGKKYLYKSVVNRDDAGMHAIRKVMRQYFKNDLSGLQQCLSKMGTELLGGEEPLSESAGALSTQQTTARQQMEDARKTLGSGGSSKPSLPHTPGSK